MMNLQRSISLISGVFLMVSVSMASAEDFKKETIQLRALYIELMNFKDNPKFHKYGYSRGGPYYVWLKDVNDIMKIDGFDDHLADIYGITPYVIWRVGREYMNSRGVETMFTKHYKLDIQKYVDNK